MLDSGVQPTRSACLPPLTGLPNLASSTAIVVAALPERPAHAQQMSACYQPCCHGLAMTSHSNGSIGLLKSTGPGFAISICNSASLHTQSAYPCTRHHQGIGHDRLTCMTCRAGGPLHKLDKICLGVGTQVLCDALHLHCRISLSD